MINQERRRQEEDDMRKKCEEKVFEARGLCIHLIGQSIADRLLFLETAAVLFCAFHND